ncbi:MAG: four helix bundle protein [Leptospiraceae bacterium]|nr:four helix bundle protein [Leptospiraceae bacterium]
MSNNKLEIPTYYPFSIEIPIRRIDLSLDVHVSFATILDIVMEAYLAFFANYKFNVLDLKESSVIFANANISYQGELFYKDIVKVEVAPDNFMEKAFDLNFRLTKENEKIPVAFVKIRVLFFNYSIKKVIPVPIEFKSNFENLSTASQSKKSNFANLPTAWQESHKLVLKLYKLTNNLPKEEADNLISRIRKSATSLPLTILEGSSRKDKKELNYFAAKCRGYIEEIKYYLILAQDLKYIENTNLIDELDSLSILIKSHFKTKVNSIQG